MNSRRPIKLRGRGEEYDLRTILGGLKDRGCSILISGVVPVGTSRIVSRRLFGHPDERRLRTLIRLRPTTSLGGWFADGIGLDDETIRIVDCTAPGRSAVDEESDFEGTRWNSDIDPTETPGLSRRSKVDDCLDEIDAAVAEFGPLGPSQLRVGVYSLNVLEGHDEMIDVVSNVSATVTGHRGMVHFHLQRPPTSEAAQTLLDHVDAMITVRKEVPNEPPMQKWTVPEYGESPWVPLRGFD